MKVVWALEKVDYVGYYQTRDIEKQFLFSEEPSDSVIAQLMASDYPTLYGAQLTDLYTEEEFLASIKGMRRPGHNYGGWELNKKRVYEGDIV